MHPSRNLRHEAHPHEHPATGACRDERCADHGSVPPPREPDQWKEGGATTPERAGYLFEIATARPPLSGELETLVEVHDRSLARYRNEPGKATDVLSHGDSENESTFPAPEQAAWTLVASLVLNLDEVLTRN